MTNSLLSGMGIDYIFFLQPQLLTESRKLPEHEDMARKMIRRVIFLREGVDAAKRRKYFFREMDKMFSNSKINYVNLMDIFPDNVEVYSDHIHYNDTGNEIIARKMFETIESNKLIPTIFLKSEN